MKYETARTIVEVYSVVQQCNYVMNFALNFLWIVGWYLLFQITRLRFLKLFIVGHVLYVLYWLLVHREHFVGHLGATSYNARLVIGIIEVSILTASTVVFAIGVCRGVRYLQKIPLKQLNGEGHSSKACGPRNST